MAEPRASRALAAALLATVWLACGTNEDVATSLEAGSVEVVAAEVPVELVEAVPVEAEADPVSARAVPFLPARVSAPFTADLTAMRERGVVRALVSLSRTDFFLDGGRPLGIQAEALLEFEKHLNRGLPRSERIRVQYVPVAFDEMIPALVEGRGDVAAAFLTRTPERERSVTILGGGGLEVNEVLVAHVDVTGLDTLEDLAGRTVHVLRASSYAEHLRSLSTRLRAEGREPIEIVEADRELVTEDLLELVNAGVFELTVADDFRAEAWSSVLDRALVRGDLVVHAGGSVGWAIRKDAPELAQAVSDFLRSVRKGSLLGNMLFRRYYDDTRWIDNPLEDAEREKLARYVGLFRKYGELYGIDWRAIAAQAYQESGLDHTRSSQAGAIGLMQVLPSTAADRRVDIEDVTDLESNVHAGVKYLSVLRDTYFDDPMLSDEDRLAFIWAAYNAGPRNVRRMRRRAEEMGLDPDRWFHHTEHAALSTVGREPVRYVSNVYKYYVTYQLAEDLLYAKGRTSLFD